MHTPTTDKQAKSRLTLGSSIGLVLLTTLAILLVPLLGMELTDQVVWTLSDFLTAAILLIATGLLYVAIARLVRRPLYRAFGGALVALLFFVVWAELAVGLLSTRLGGS